MKLHAITLTALVLVATMTVQAADVPPECPPDKCTKEYNPVCGIEHETGEERTFGTNCSMLTLSCENIFVRNGEC